MFQLYANMFVKDCQMKKCDITAPELQRVIGLFGSVGNDPDVIHPSHVYGFVILCFDCFLWESTFR